MSTTNWTVFWIIASLLVGGFFLNFLCEVGVKCKNCDRVSQSKDEAIKENLFVASYKPVHDKHQLKNYDELITFDEIWVENGWTINSDICLWKKREKTKYFNAIVEFEKSSNGTFNFTLEGLGSNWGMGENSKRATIHSLPDTLIIYIMEKNPNASNGWKEPVAGDTVLFVKKSDSKIE